MKKLITTLFLSLICCFFPLVVQADSTHIQDNAALLSPSEIANLEEKAQSLSDEIKGSVYLLTTDTNQEETREFAIEYLREKVGNNQNGALLVLDMGQRKIQIVTSGNMIDYLDDQRLDTIYDTLEENMGNGAYYETATAFYDQAAAYVQDGVPGGHYRIDEETGKITYYKSITLFEGVIAIGLAAIAAIGFFLVIKSKYQLKLGTYSYPYQENSNVQLTVNENQLTNSFVTTRKIPRNTNNSGGFGGGSGGSSTTSSGGGTFGGGGGRSF